MWEHTRGKTLTDRGRQQQDGQEPAGEEEPRDRGDDGSAETRSGEPEQAGLARWAE